MTRELPYLIFYKGLFMSRIVVRSVTSERGSQRSDLSFLYILCVFFHLHCRVWIENKSWWYVLFWEVYETGGRAYGLKMLHMWRIAGADQNRERERGSQITHWPYGQTFLPPTSVLIFDRWWRNYQPPSFFRW